MVELTFQVNTKFMDFKRNTCSHWITEVKQRWACPVYVWVGAPLTDRILHDIPALERGTLKRWLGWKMMNRSIMSFIPSSGRTFSGRDGVHLNSRVKDHAGKILADCPILSHCTCEKKRKGLDVTCTRVTSYKLKVSLYQYDFNWHGTCR